MSGFTESRCRLCGGAGSRLDAPLGSFMFSYLRCGVCGYIGLATRHFPSKAEEEKRYLLHRNSASDSGYIEYLRRFIEQALVPFLPQGSTILDFGSGPEPVLSAEIMSAGFKCESYDPFFDPQLSWQERSYKAIVMHEVVEHLHTPRQTLLDIVPRLENGGILAIRTRFPPSETEAFRSWWYRMDPTHVGFFTPASLERLLAPEGIHAFKRIEPDIIVLGRT